MVQPISVLLVDDQPRSIIALEAALARLDCRLVIARSGREALKCTLAQDFAVIVLDVQMPEMDGFETADLIRSRARSQATPIVFLTANDRDSQRVLEGYRLGAVDFLYKPFDAAILRAKVAVFVQLFRQRAALEQRTAELTSMAARLQRSEDHFRALIEHTSDLTLIVEDTGVIRYASPSVERLLGYSGVQLAGRPLAEFLHPDDVVVLQTDAERAAETGPADATAGQRWRQADGTYRVLESTASNLLKTISVSGFVLHARDVTERNHAAEQVRALNAELEERVRERTAAITKLESEVVERLRTEQTLRESEERFRSQYKGFPLPTYSWLHVGDDFVLQEFNDAAEASSGGALADWIGSRASERLVDQPEVLADLRACLSERHTIKHEVGHRYRASGQERQLVFTYVFVPPQTVMVHTEDVTDSRLAEQQGKTLAQSEKLRALGQMASGIAHDLNQSLMLVASFSELARQALVHTPPDLAEVEDLLITTTQAAMDGGETVKQLLLYTRGASKHDNRSLDISSVVQDAALLTAPRWREVPRAEGRPISLDVEVDSHPSMQGSPARLRELLINLIFNAVDALPHGGAIHLRVKTEDGRAVIEVADSGIGMSLEVQKRVFEPFFTTKGENGTGLGLAMAFGIVQQHGGDIEVTSVPGHGSTFRLSFPLLDPGTEPRAALATAALEPVAARRLLRVLVVDDEPIMTRALVRMLAPSSHIVTVAASAEEALEQLTAKTFDAVVSDLRMGNGMNGLDLADLVRQRWPSVRFLLASSVGALIDPDQAAARGVATILNKPYHTDELIRALATSRTA